MLSKERCLVGPRPEIPELDEEIERTSPFWKCRYLLKPGITGWAQIKYQYASDWKVRRKNYPTTCSMVKNAPFPRLEIILSTLRSIMKEADEEDFGHRGSWIYWESYLFSSIGSRLRGCVGQLSNSFLNPWFGWESSR